MCVLAGQYFVAEWDKPHQQKDSARTNLSVNETTNTQFTNVATQIETITAIQTVTATEKITATTTQFITIIPSVTIIDFQADKHTFYTRHGQSPMAQF
jgi:hypothetical protein